MARNKDAATSSTWVVGQYTRWANRVINGLLKEVELEESLIPDSFGLSGVNIVRHNNGTVSIGFVFRKEEN